MSRVYFDSPSGGAELLGAERSHASMTVRRIACGVLDAFSNHDRLCELVAPGHYLAAEPAPAETMKWARWFDTALVAETDRPVLQYDGRPIDGGDLLCNTAIAVGSDPVRFLSRMDAQCEIHGYVEGPNRAWLAGIIEQGLADGVLRRAVRYQPHPEMPREEWPAREMGWDGVTALLRARDDEPVVMSSSFCDRFPNVDVAGWEPPADVDLSPDWAAEAPGEWAELEEDHRQDWRDQRRGELFDQLPPAERWRLALEGLRARNEAALLELAPDDWASFRFGHRLTAFDLQAEDYRERLARALGLTAAR